jgi:pantoate--beta-alanine ligase
MSNQHGSGLGTVRDVESLRRRVQGWRQGGLSVALVPTMGALHQGHMKLMDQAQKMADRVVATIFINPKQFGPTEDLSSYPKREADDFELLNAAGVNLLFAPDAATMYPPGFATTVVVAGVSEILDGQHREDHFNGVVTVVSKLLMQTLPDIALFGEKDYQQLVLIQRFVEDLNIPVDIIGVPTEREVDGLAMSSRNTYLSSSERTKAPVLYAAISAAAAEIAGGGDIEKSLQRAREKLTNAGFGVIDYVEARGAVTLAVLTDVNEPGRILAAAHLGEARLIDNVPIPSEP